MPSDSNGIYVLPDGYLAVTGETIQASQHNPPLEDLQDAQTARLMRSGVAPMTGPLKHSAGAVGAPSVTFNGSTTTGLYKTTNGIGVAINGTLVFEFTASGVYSTGDMKPTFKTAADIGWVMADDGTIGNGASSASNRANADTEALYTLIYNGVSDTYAPVSTGRGANAAADFAAGKTLTLPKMLGRALAVAGAGSGLTSRALGVNLGTETHALSADENGTHTHVFTGDALAAHTHFGQRASTGTGGGIYIGGFQGAGSQDSPQSSVSAGTPSGTNANSGLGTAHNNMPPETFVNVMIKL